MANIKGSFRGVYKRRKGKPVPVKLSSVKRDLGLLNDTFRTVMVMRYGLNGGKRKTLQQIATELNITKQRVYQIERAALAFLRRAYADKKKFNKHVGDFFIT